MDRGLGPLPVPGRRLGALPRETIPRRIIDTPFAKNGGDRVDREAHVDVDINSEIQLDATYFTSANFPRTCLPAPVAV